MKPGDRYGRLQIVKTFTRQRDGRRMAHVVCDCGKKKDVQRGNLSSGHTTSCGCYHAERVRKANTKHGHTPQRTPTYLAWNSMVTNCTCRSSGGWDRLGAIGVTVCERWLGERGFEHFLADMGSRPDGLALTRRDKAKGYTPSNTYWATRRETDRNTVRNTFYKVGTREQCLVDWAAEYNIPKSTLHYRVVTRGMSMRDALDVGRGRQGKLLFAAILARVQDT